MSTAEVDDNIKYHQEISSQNEELLGTIRQLETRLVANQDKIRVAEESIQEHNDLKHIVEDLNKQLKSTEDELMDTRVESNSIKAALLSLTHVLSVEPVDSDTNNVQLLTDRISHTYDVQIKLVDRLKAELDSLKTQAKERESANSILTGTIKSLEGETKTLQHILKQEVSDHLVLSKSKEIKDKSRTLSELKAKEEEYQTQLTTLEASLHLATVESGKTIRGLESEIEKLKGFLKQEVMLHKHNEVGLTQEKIATHQEHAKLEETKREILAVTQSLEGQSTKVDQL